MTADTAFIMWLGELITQRGVGNGMSLLIFSSVVVDAAGPGQRGVAGAGRRLVRHHPADRHRDDRRRWSSWSPGQRRIPVQFAKRVVGRRMYGGQSTYIPLKVNQSGVIPVIFASSVLYFPVLLANIVPVDDWVQNFIDDNLARQDSIWYIASSPLLIVVLRLLLHGDQLQPGPAGRHHPAPGRVHPRVSDRASPPSTTCPRCSTASRCPASLFLAFIALVPLIVRSPIFDIRAVRVRRDDAAHHRRRGAGDDAPDRRAAHATQLRGVPHVTSTSTSAVHTTTVSRRMLILGKQGAGKGTQSTAHRRAVRHPPHLHRRHAARRGARGHRVRPPGQGVHGRRRPRPRRGDPGHGRRAPGPARRVVRLPPRRLPAHPGRRPRAWPRCWATWPRRGRGARRPDRRRRRAHQRPPGVRELRDRPDRGVARGGRRAPTAAATSWSSATTTPRRPSAAAWQVYEEQTAPARRLLPRRVGCSSPSTATATRRRS